uniref:ATP synthase F0 subunit 8 n=1 Tax=Craterolophus convolvulus TaxID=37531 RepID=G9IT56_9CNID|nr:ATP synthase F0 subunit 8 [Craterolophus convolvulus]
MPQLDLVTFITQFSGALLGLTLLGGIFLYKLLPSLKTSLKARNQNTAQTKVELTLKDPLYKKVLQSC